MSSSRPSHVPKPYLPSPTAADHVVNAFLYTGGWQYPQTGQPDLEPHLLPHWSCHPMTTRGQPPSGQAFEGAGVLVTLGQDGPAEGLQKVQGHGFATSGGEGLGNLFNMLGTATQAVEFILQSVMHGPMVQVLPVAECRGPATLEKLHFPEKVSNDGLNEHGCCKRSGCY